MAKEYTLEELQKMGGVPVDTEQQSYTLQQLQDMQQQTTTTPPKTGFLQKVKNLGTELLKVPGNLTMGSVKSLGSHLIGAGELPLKAAATIPAFKSEAETGIQQGEEWKKALTPTGITEKLGGALETIAEFLAPSGIIAKTEKGISTAIKGAEYLPKIAQKVLPTAAKMGIEAGTFGGQTAIQQGDVDNNAKVAAIVGAMFPLGGEVLGAIKGALKPIGEKIEATVIRPTAKDLKDGFKISNVNKYNVGGSLKDIVAKTHIKLNELSQQLTEKLKGSNVSVNLNDIYQQTADTLLQSKAKNFGDIGAINKAIGGLKNEIKEISGKNGLVDLIEANFIKRGAGTKGAWAFGRFEPDAKATETVYDTFYNKLKTAIEQAAPEGKIKDINKQMSELIPISNAALRRLPIEQRNNVISLTDSIGLFSAVFDPKELILIGANKLSKSGKFGEFLVKVAEGQPKSAIGKRILGTPEIKNK